MSGRILRGLLIALGALVLAYGIARWVGGGPEGPASEALALESAAEAEIDSVVIVASERTVRLRRAGSGWTVNGHEAIADAGESLEEALERARTGRLVSRNPENHERLGVSDATGRRVTFFSDGEPTLIVVLGEASRTGGRYVRRAGEDEVYVLEGELPRLVERDVDGWRNRDIVSVPRDEVHRIELQHADTSFAIVRDSAGWRLEPGGAEAEPAEIADLLGQVASLRALGFAEDSVADSLSWDEPAARVRLEGAGGAELARLLFQEQDETGYYVRREDRPIVYTISRFAGESILKRPADLVADGGSGAR